MRVGLPSYPYSFLIEKRGNLIVAQDSRGRIQYSGTDAASVINNARSALGALSTGAPGTIYVKKATYDVSSDIIIGKKTHLICEPGTVFRATAAPSQAVIVIDPTDLEDSCWKLENVYVDLNGYNGHGVYCEWCGKSDSRQLTPTIRDLKVKNVQSGYAGLFLYDPFYMLVESVRIHSNYGTGIKIRQRATSPYVVTGNSVFNEIFVAINGNNAIGVDLEGDGTKDPVNLCVWNRLQTIQADASLTGTIGLRIKKAAQDSVFILPDIEGSETGIYIEDAIEIDFFGGICTAPTPPQIYSVRFVGAANYIHFYGTTLDGWTDETDGTRNLLFVGGRFWGTLTKTASTRFVNVKGKVTDVVFDTGDISIPIGVNGAFGAETKIVDARDYFAVSQLVLEAFSHSRGGTFGTGETLTVRTICTFDDGSTAYVDRSYTSTGGNTYNAANMNAEFQSTMFRNPNKNPVKCSVQAKTNLSSTTVTLTCRAIGFVR
jgi:hypothetical protein